MHVTEQDKIQARRDLVRNAASLLTALAAIVAIVMAGAAVGGDLSPLAELGPVALIVVLLGVIAWNTGKRR